MKFRRPEHIHGGQSQALFYHLATVAGFEVWTEYTVWLRAEGWVKPHRTRFDAVVVHQDEIIAIIECKDRKGIAAYRRRVERGEEPSEQEQRYLAHNVPLIYVHDENDIIAALDALDKLRTELDEQLAWMHSEERKRYVERSKGRL